jgi:hypothetical protein
LTETNAHFEITDLSDLVRRRIEAAQCKAGDQIIILERGKASNASDSYSYRYLATDSFFAGPIISPVCSSRTPEATRLQRLARRSWLYH